MADSWDIRLDNTADSVLGGNGNDVIYTGDGQDTVVYDASSYKVYAGDGVDVLMAGNEFVGMNVDLSGPHFAEFENVVGSSVADTLLGTQYADEKLVGGAGDDFIDGRGGNDVLDGGAGNDTIVYNDKPKAVMTAGIGIDSLDVTAYDSAFTVDLSKKFKDFENVFGSLTHSNNMTGSANDNVLVGGADRDIIRGGLGNDSLVGLDDNDLLDGGVGNDTIYGGYGDDTIVYDSADLVSHIHGEQGNDWYDASKASTAKTPVTIILQDDMENIVSGAGNDTLIGNVWDNYIDGGAGFDSIDGGQGNDTIIYDGLDLGTQVMDSGTTDGDVLDASKNLKGVQIVSNDTSFAGFETILGGIGDDTLTGYRMANYIFGGKGKDVIDGGLGSDTLIGGDGADTIVYDANDALVLGGNLPELRTTPAGWNDNSVYHGDYQYGSAVAVYNDTEVDVLDARQWKNDIGIDLGAAPEESNFLGFEYFRSGSGNDSIIGSNVANYITGGAGNDWLVGLRGKDTLTGEAGNDNIYGGNDDDFLSGDDGNDFLSGGLGQDTLLGGAGNDILDGDGEGAEYGNSRSQYFSGYTTLQAGKTVTTTFNVTDSRAIRDLNVSLSGLDALGAGDKVQIYLVGPDGTRVKLIASNSNTQSSSYMVFDDQSSTVSEHAMGSLAAYNRKISKGTWKLEVTLAGVSVGVDYSATLDFQYAGAGDVIQGGDGNDLYYYDVADNVGKVTGGTGDDTIDASSEYEDVKINLASQFMGFEDIISGSGNDILVGNKDANYLYGNSGQDKLDGAAGNDTLDGACGNDTLLGGDGNDLLVGSYGNDALNGDKGNDILQGGDGNDVLDGGLGNDTMYGGAGNDWVIYDEADGLVIGGVGYPTFAVFGDVLNDTLFGSNDDGTDMLDASRWKNGININLGTSRQFIGFDNMIGTGKNDSIVGSETDNWIQGGAGLDTIDVRGSGNDTIDGGAGIDIITLGDGNDWIIYDAIDQITFGNGVYTADASAWAKELAVDLANDSKWWNYRNVLGGKANDKIVGNALDNFLSGGGGSDTIDGGAGNDTVIFDKADNALFVQGGAGNDWLDASSNGKAAIIVMNDTHYAGFENLAGSAYNDFLVGNSQGNVISAGNGDDYVAGGQGNDTIDGGAGRDLIDGDAGNDLIFAGDGNDTIRGGEGNDILYGEAGNDVFVYNASSKDLFIGDNGYDVLDASTETVGRLIDMTGLSLYRDVEEVRGGRGDDTLIANSTEIGKLVGNAGNDILLGGDANEILIGGTGIDSLYGGAGNDTLIYDTRDQLDGGSGSDFIDASSYERSVTINLENQYRDIENILGSAGNDNLTGSSGSNILLGGAGNDILSGHAGADTLDGGEGCDTIVGDEGADWLFGGNGDDWLDGSSGSDAISGGAGNDTYSYDSYDSAAVIKGDDGIDVIDARSAVTGANIILTSLHYADFENVIGSTLNDNVIDQFGANNRFEGGLGSDILSGGAGRDSLYGGAGNDYLYGGSDTDILDGGTGNDTLVYYQGDGNDLFSGGEGSDWLVVNAPNNDLVIDLMSSSFTLDGKILTFSGIENLSSSAGNDSLTGSSADNTVFAGAGDDRVVGAGGNDILDGGAGNDILTAGAGSDSLSGGDGNDIVVGAGGSDILDGGAGNDILNAGTGSDSLSGGTGNDTLIVTLDGMDSLSGGAGWDVLDASVVNDVVIDLTALNRDNDIEAIQGSRGADTITANVLGNFIDGAGGHDIIDGGTGDDTIKYYAGDMVAGGSGNDWLSAIGNDAVTIDLAAAAYSSIENSKGSSAADTLSGNAVNNIIRAGSGNDRVSGGDGNDTLVGDEITINHKSFSLDAPMKLNNLNITYAKFAITDQRFVAGLTITFDIQNIDTSKLKAALVGPDGKAVMLFEEGDYRTSVTLTADQLRLFESKQVTGEWKLVFGSADDNNLGGIIASGTKLDFTLTDEAGNDSLSGGSGNDFLSGGYGDDTLLGGVGNDSLDGYNGADYLNGEGGNDTLNGGAGNDTLVYQSDAKAYFNGGSGNDVLIVTGNDAVFINCSTNRFSGVETLLGGVGDDTLIAGASGIVMNGGVGNDSIVGGSSRDSLYGGAGDDTLDGRSAGNDWLDGGIGNDYLMGGDNDTLLGGTGNDTFSLAGVSAVVLTADQGDVIQLSGIGENTFNRVDKELYLGSNNDIAMNWFNNDGSFTSNVAGYFADVATGKQYVMKDRVGGAGDDIVLDGTGMDSTLSGGAGDDLLYGFAGNDSLYGDTGNDTLYGGAGNDYLVGGSGNDSLSGGSGNDTLVYQTDSGAYFDGGAGYDILDASGSVTAINSNHIINIERVIGSRGDDYIGLDASNTYLGSAGNDTIFAGGGNDTVAYNQQYTGDNVHGEAGFDYLDASAQTVGAIIDLNSFIDFEAAIGGLGNDSLVGNVYGNLLDGGAGSDTIIGGSGNDTVVYDGADLAVNLFGNDGFDMIDASRQTAALTIDLNAYSSFEGIVSGSGNDVLVGNGFSNYLDGGAGNDTISGGVGRDTYVYDGADLAVNIHGGGGIDDIDAHHAGQNVVINMVDYADFENLAAGSGDDTIYDNGLDNKIVGNGGNDVVIIDAGNDTIEGGDGDDTFKIFSSDSGDRYYGNDGIDTVLVAVNTGLYVDVSYGNSVEFLIGGAGNDTLVGNEVYSSGGAGNDLLYAIQGDSLVGGLGADTYVFNDTAAGNDWIIDDGLKDNCRDTVQFSNTNLAAFTFTHTGNVLTIGENGLVVNVEHWSDNNGHFDIALINVDANEVNPLGYLQFGNNTYGVKEVTGGADNDIVFDLTTTGGNVLDAKAGNDIVWGSISRDTIIGGDGADMLFGNAGNDWLDGGAGNDTVRGGAGNDTIVYAAGNDTLMGEGGSDWLVFNNDTAINVNLAANSFKTIANDILNFTGFENILSGAGNDTIVGTNNSYVDGGSGNDLLTAGTTGNTLKGGAGSDTYAYDGTYNFSIASDSTNSSDVLQTNRIFASFSGLARNGNDVTIGIVGGVGSVVVNSWLGANAAFTGAALGSIAFGNDVRTFRDGSIIGNSSTGNDIIYDFTSEGHNMSANDGQDYIVAGDGCDTVFGGTGDDTMYGGNDDDVLQGETGSDRLIGDAGNDYINGGAGHDYVSGGTGSDTVVYDGGNDSLYGDGGDDWLVMDTSVAVAIDLAANTMTTAETGEMITMSGFENLIGSRFGDTLKASSAAASTVISGDGKDMLVAQGVYSDTLDGGNDDDLLQANGSDILTGGQGNDTFDITGNQNIINDFGHDSDVLKIAAVVINENLFTLNNKDLIVNNQVTIKNWTNVTQGQFQIGTEVYQARINNGTTGNDIVLGNTMSDSLIGSGGNDYLIGFDGDDLLDGGLGNDVFYGGAGNDTLIYQNDAASDTLNGDSGNDWVVYNGTENISINLTAAKFTSVENVQSGAGNDNLVAIVGTTGSMIKAGDGNDILTANGGDILYGETGTDTFIFSGTNNVIADASAGDIIQIAGIAVATMFTRTGNDLKIVDGGSDVKVQNWFGGNGAGAIRVGGASGILYTTTSDDAANILFDGGSNTLDGQGGNDLLFGFDGDDNLNGGLGNDTLFGGEGNDTLMYQNDAANDKFYGGNDSDWVVYNGTENVSISLNNAKFVSVENIQSGSGNDTLIALSGNSMIKAGDGNDTLTANGGDTLYGETGNDIFIFSGSNNVIADASMSDIIQIAGSDITTMFTRTGNDLKIVDGVNNLTVQNWFSGNIAGAIRVGGPSGLLYNTISNDDANILFATGSNTLAGQGGNDLLFGFDGNDSLNGGLGNDTLFGGDGNDTLMYQNDEANDKFYGGNDSDWIVYNGTENVSIDLTSGKFNSVENVQSGAGNDSLVAQNGSILSAGDGNDILTANGYATLYGGNGNDTFIIIGTNNVIADAGANDTIQMTGLINAVDRSGNDLIIDNDVNTIAVQNWFAGKQAGMINLNGTLWTTTAGNDNNILIDTAVGGGTLNGMDGTDILFGLAGDDSLAGGNGNDELHGGNGNDVLYGGNNDDDLIGEEGADTLQGEEGADQLYGGNDDDMLYGGNDSDTLYGEYGNDVLYGGNDSDLLDGGEGNDVLYGGNDGAIDTYQFGAGNGNDTIAGTFSDSHDIIDLYQLSWWPGFDFHGEGITRSGNDIVFSFSAGDSLTVQNWDVSGITRVDDGAGRTFTLVMGGDNADTLSSANDTVHYMLAGASGNDQITGNNQADYLLGGAGSDILIGGNGADTLLGGSGDDVLAGGNDGAADVYFFDGIFGKDTILGSQSNSSDIIRLDPSLNASFNDAWQSGNDWVLDFGAYGSITVQNGNDARLQMQYYATGTGWQNVTLYNGFGTAGNDNLTSGSSRLYAGGAGNDTLGSISTSSSVLLGGAGNDVLQANYYSILSGGTGADTLYGVGLYDTLIGGSGDDSLKVNQQGWLYGDDGNDTLNGSYWGSDILSGGAGNDKVFGLAGADTLQGGLGNDTLDAGGYDGYSDVIIWNSGDGNDLLQNFDANSGTSDVLAFNCDASKVTAGFDESHHLMFSIDTGAGIQTITFDTDISDVTEHIFQATFNGTEQQIAYKYDSLVNQYGWDVWRNK